MATFTKRLLSYSSDGMPIQIVEVGTGGDEIHSAVAGSTSFDEVWIYANNISSVPVTLTIEFGRTTSAGRIITSIPPGVGLQCVVPGLPLNNSKVISAYASSASVINITGFVNRIE